MGKQPLSRNREIPQERRFLTDAQGHHAKGIQLHRTNMERCREHRSIMYRAPLYVLHPARLRVSHQELDTHLP